MTQIEQQTVLSIQDEKKALRARMRALLQSNALKNDALNAASCNACSCLLASAMYKNAALILAYMPLPEELDILPAIKAALHAGKAVAVPKTAAGSNDMDFYLLKNGLAGSDEKSAFDSQFERGVFGIREPKSGLSKLTLSDMRQAAEAGRLLVLVPALAFDSAGARLGRGKGFYDKFLFGLKQENAVTCGVCFGFQVVPSVPAAQSDFSVGSILSETGLIRAAAVRR